MNGTKRLSIDEPAKECDSKKRPFNEISNENKEPEKSDDASFATANDKSTDSKKVESPAGEKISPNSKRLKLDESPPKNEGLSSNINEEKKFEEAVEVPPVEAPTVEVPTVAEPENAAEEQPSKEKPAAAEVDPAIVEI